jgi:hypothetical protein
MQPRKTMKVAVITGSLASGGALGGIALAAAAPTTSTGAGTSETQTVTTRTSSSMSGPRGNHGRPCPGMGSTGGTGATGSTHGSASPREDARAGSYE